MNLNTGRLIMRLQKAIIAAIIGLSILFVSRSLATFFLGFFSDLAIATINSVLLLLAMIAVLYFSVVFLQEFVKPTDERLRNGTIILIAAVSIVVLLQAKSFLGMVLSYRYYFFHERFLFEPIAAWVAAVLSLMFFIIFYREYQGTVRLKKAILLGLIGSAAALIPRTVTTFSSVFYPEIRSIQEYHSVILAVGFVLIVFSFYASLKFLITFYEQQKQPV